LTCIVENDLIGTDAAGDQAVANVVGVMYLTFAKPEEHDVRVVDSVVSGNLLDGILGATQVTGSRIGTNAGGSAAVPNGAYGVAGTQVVGGPRPFKSSACVDPCNVISGNAMGGVEGTATVEGNFIGTNLAGTAAIPNGDYWSTAEGRSLSAHPRASSYVPPVAASSSKLGGPSSAISGICDRACNLISGNNESAVSSQGNGQVLVQGNVVGLSSTGAPLPNQGDGLLDVNPFTELTIGGPVGGSSALGTSLGNVIADNTGDAVKALGIGGQTSGMTAPAIEGNAITGNAGGIVYEAGIPAPKAPTHLLVTPAKPGPGVTLSGTLPGWASSSSYARTTIDVYGDATCEPGPQGAVPLVTATSSLLTGDFNIDISNARSLKYFTVTATDGGSTSPFSACASAQPGA
jgi:hypothetical protein